MDLDRDGWTRVEGSFSPDYAGERRLLDVPGSADAAVQLKRQLVAIQAISFDKTPRTNRKVAWHQDVMFPLARPARHAARPCGCRSLR